MSSAGDVLRLRESLSGKLDEREPIPQRFRATMGDGTGAVVVPGKPNYVYVRRLGRGLIEECLNNKAAARDGLPIIAGYSHESPDVLQVLEVDWYSFSAPGAYPYTQHHHDAHELHNVIGGDDVVWIQSQQLMPLLVYPTSPASMRVNVFGGWYPWASGWHYFEPTLSADLTAHVPALAANARYVLISIDGATEALQYTAGAVFSIFMPPVDAENMVPAPPVGSIPVGAVYLPNGTTALDWDNLYDMRLFNQPVGGSITPGVHALLDTTVHSDTAIDAPTRGSLIYANATPLWDELVHPAAAGYALTTDANDVAWDQTPAWTGEHSFMAGIAFTGASGANEITVPDNIAIALELLDAGALEYMRIVSTNANPYVLLDPAGAGIKVAIGLAVPNQQLTVEGTIDLKEQAAANPDTAAYGQIWVKDATPNELWFTDDTGVDVQLGLGAGGLPAVAGAGYALVSDGVNSWVADQTPAWTGEHSFGAGIAFTGATGVNAITIPDNLANALHITDAGDADVYLQIVTTTGSEEIIFNAGGDDVDFTVQAVGVADALQVQGSDGQITLGALTAGYVKSNAGGVLSIATEVPLIDLGSYTQGDLIYGGAADWQDLAIGGIGDFLWVNAAGTEPEWHTLVVGDIPAHALLGTQHSDTTTDAPTRGSLIIGNATPAWDELVHPGTKYHLQTTNDIVWAQNITMADGAWIGIGVANEAIIFDTAGDIAVMGADFGVGTLTPVRELHVGDGADATFQTYVGITANVAGIAQVSARNSTNNIEIGMFAHTAQGYMGTWTTHALSIRTNNLNRIDIAAGGQVKITNLAGAGVRNVVAAADGTLSAP